MPASSFCPKCLSGTVHEGIPTGRIHNVAGTETYIAKDVPVRSNKTIVLLTDVFGHTSPNVQLLADEYGKAGFNAVVPDILHGKAMSRDMFQGVRTTNELFKILNPWLVEHGPETVLPVLDTVLDELRAQEQRIGVIGFCFGGKYAFHFAATDKVDAACAMHPTLIDIPRDVEGVVKPISVHVAARDEIYDAEMSRGAARILCRNAVPHENRVYDGEGVEHGFSTRADLSKPAAKEAKEAAIAATIAWFQTYL